MESSSFNSTAANQEAEYSLRQKLPSQSIKSHSTQKRFNYKVIKSVFNSNLNGQGYMMIFNETENA